MTSKLVRICILLATAFLGLPSAHAATHVWSGAVNGLWSNPGNWSSGGVPAVFETPPLVLVFAGSAPNHNSTNDIGADPFVLAVDQIYFFGNNYVLAGMNGGTNLVLTGYDTPSAPNNIYSSGTNNVFDYSLTCYLANTNVVYIAGGANLTMESCFTGPGGFTFTGPGSCVFNGGASNSFTGTFNVEEGNVYLENFYLYDLEYGGVGNQDVAALSGSITVGMASNSVSANLYVQRNQQFGTNCDITVNSTGFIEFDRSSLVSDYYYNFDSPLNNQAHSLSIIGGSMYLGEVVFLYYQLYTDDSVLGTNIAVLTVDDHFVAAAGPDTGQSPYVEGPGQLTLTGCAASVSSPYLFLSASSEGFNKLGPGTLDIYGGTQGSLTVAQGDAEIVSSGVILSEGLTVSNGAEMDILANCSGGFVALDLSGRGISGSGAPLNVSNSVTLLDVQNVTLHGDTAINVANSTDQLSLQADWFTYAVYGTNNLFKTGAGRLQFLDFIPNVPADGNINGWVPASNIFSGTFYVESGSAYFNSDDTYIDGGYPLDGGIALGGPIVIGTNTGVSSGYVELDGNRQLATNVQVTVNPGCELVLSGTNEQTFGALTLNGGVVSGGNVILNGNVTAQNFSIFNRPQIGPSSISLDGTNRNFNVASGSTLSLYGNITDGGAPVGMDKTGLGELDLYGTNQCSGFTQVSAGRLGAEVSGAFSPPIYTVLVLSNAEVALYGGVQIGAVPLFLIGSGEDGFGALKGYGTNTWGGMMTILSNAVIGSVTNPSHAASQLELSGPISGSGGLTLDGGGVLLLDGSQANTYSGTTTIQQGLLELGKPGVLAVPGPLLVGPGTGPAVSVGTKCLQPGELNPVASLTLNSDAYLDLTSVNSSAAGSVTGSGRIEMGIGTTFTTGADNTSGTYSGPITGLDATLVKIGSGTWTVSGTSTMTGEVLAEGGNMFVDGYLGNSSCVVSNAATLSGTGTVGALTALAGSTIAPGNGPGILNSSSVTFNSSSILAVDLTGPNAGTGYSQLNVTGTVTENTPALQLHMTEAGSVGALYTIINNDLTDAVTGNFAGLPEGATVTANTGAKFTISYRGGTGNDVVLTQTSPVTAPGLTGIKELGNRTIQLNGYGLSNLTYSVWATTNLAKTNWIDLGTTAAIGTNLQFIDLGATNLPQRFYRFSWP